MPTFGIVDQGENPAANASGVTGILDNIAGDSAIIWDAFPLTFDGTIEPTDSVLENHSLQDLVGGNEWRLRRIVGKFHAGALQHLRTTETIAPPQDVALGFIVCKTFDDGSPTTDFNEVNPLARIAMEDPWIWRRRWILNPHPGNYTFAPDFSQSLDTQPAYLRFPNTTSEYGSVLDGPHVDQKTNRHIHRQERLFAVIAMRHGFSDSSIISYQSVKLWYQLDYRLLGSILRAPTGNRRNASR